jgi:hypothetical protein
MPSLAVLAQDMVRVCLKVMICALHARKNNPFSQFYSVSHIG